MRGQIWTPGGPRILLNPAQMLGQHGRLGQIARGVLAGTPVAAAEVRAAAVAELETAGLAPVEAVVREADLCIGDRRKVSLANGLEVELRLLSVRNRRDGVNGSLRSAAVEVEWRTAWPRVAQFHAKTNKSRDF